MSRIFLTLASFAFIISGQAYAATFDEAGAAKLKQSFQRVLDYQKNVNESFGNVLIEYKGDLAVTPQNDHYAMTLPQIEIHGTAPEDSNDLILNLGTITASAIPGDKDGEWKMAIVLPAAYHFTDNTGEVMAVTIGGQSIVALFSDKLGYFTKSVANLEKVTVAIKEDDTDISLGSVEFKTGFEEDASGLHSGTGFLSIGNLGITDQKQTTAVQIGTLKFDLGLERTKFLTIEEYAEKLLKHKDTLAAMNNPEKAASLTPDQLMNMFYDLYNLNMGGTSGRYSVENFSVTYLEDEAKPESKKTVRLAKGNLGVALHDMDKDLGKFNMDVGFSGITMEPAIDEYKDIAPQDLQINIAADKVPVKSLKELGTNTIEGIKANPEMAEMAGLTLMMKLPMILSQAGTTLSIKNTGVKGSAYDASLEGDIIADMNALASVTAKLNGMFIGLDKLLDIAKKNAAVPDQPYAGDFEQMATTLEMIKTKGKAAKDATGRDGYSYEILITPQGQTTINGEPLIFGTPETAPAMDGTVDVEITPEIGAEPDSSEVVQ